MWEISGRNRANFKIPSRNNRHIENCWLTVVDVTVAQTRQAVAIGDQFGLLITDATHVSTLQAHKIAHIATDAEDLWHIPGVTAWAP